MPPRPRLPRWVPLIVASLIFALAAALTPAPAFGATPSCGNGRFAVGGYPRPDLVPDGYQYTGTPGGIFFWEAKGYAHGQSVGAANLVAAVDAHAARCAGPIRVFGHSYGAGIVDTATETINSRDYAHRVHVHVTGSPRHPGGIEDSWYGLNLVGMGFRGAVATPDRVATYRSDCAPRDPICDMPPWHNPLGAVDHWVGYLFQGTHSYS